VGEEIGRRPDPNGDTGPKQIAAAKQDLVVIMTRPGDRWRSRRIRRWAHRELDRLLETDVDPWQFSEPRDWHETHMDLGVSGRDRLGRDLVGWCP
jgi:hypothetical protein